MPCEHIIFDEQVADWVTWVTPDKAMPVDSFSLDPGVEYVTRRVTGTCRDLNYAWLGQKLVTGSLEMPFWWEYMGYFLKASGLHDIDSTQQGATTAYQHGFIPKHDTMPLGLSVQAKRDADDADNVLGVLLNSVTISCTAGEPVVFSAEYIGYDEAPTDGTWDYDGSTAAPAVIASPTYFASTVLPFRFQHATLNVGSTLTWVGGENVYTKAGGAAATIESIEITWTNNYDPRVFLGSRVPGNVIGQDFEVSGRFDLDQSTVSETFRNYYRAGTTNAIWVEIDSGVEADTGYNYLARVVVPNVFYNAGGLPDVSGSNDRRMQSVEFTGLQDSDGNSLNVQLVDTATSY